MIKTILAIVLFGLAFKASGVFAEKQAPDEVVLLPDGAAADDAAAPDDDQPSKAPLAAENFLIQAEAYIDARPGMRRQHKALVAQLGLLSDSGSGGTAQSGQEEPVALQAGKDIDVKS
ncbi:MAG: hypothetical protein ACI9JM_001563 [Halioglobus sp.]|jgi:hypothetical protein